MIQKIKKNRKDMFTGIIETLGTLKNIAQRGENLELQVESVISGGLKIDQSVSHNGVCLTVIDCHSKWHKVQVIKETLDKSTVGKMSVGEKVNLERSVKLGGRIDGHLLQGHVDNRGRVEAIEEHDGSHYLRFSHPEKNAGLLVPKGSISIDGVSLTVVECGRDDFSVAIIPYTFEHTIFHRYEIGAEANLEYDILGKYIQRQAFINPVK